MKDAEITREKERTAAALERHESGVYPAGPFMRCHSAKLTPAVPASKMCSAAEAAIRASREAQETIKGDTAAVRERNELCVEMTLLYGVCAQSYSCCCCKCGHLSAPIPGVHFCARKLRPCCISVTIALEISGGQSIPPAARRDAGSCARSRTSAPTRKRVAARRSTGPPNWRCTPNAGTVALRQLTLAHIRCSRRQWRPACRAAWRH